MNIEEEIAKYTSKLTGAVTEKAKDSAISTLKDPEFKATVSQFTKDWIDENKFYLAAIFGGFVLFSAMAVVNIVSNFRVRR